MATGGRSSPRSSVISAWYATFIMACSIPIRRFSRQCPWRGSVRSPIGRARSSKPDEDELGLWVSGLDELSASSDGLGAYLTSLSRATAAGKHLFTLYGGFFAVLASACRTEWIIARNWLWRVPELSRSGPPPPRYYLARLHRYVARENAQQLWELDEALVGCSCDECSDRQPIELEYHDLMKHSVEVRAEEISEWSPRSAALMITKLEEDLSDFLDRLLAANPTDLMWHRILRSSQHINSWISALRFLT